MAKKNLFQHIDKAPKDRTIYGWAPWWQHGRVFNWDGKQWVDTHGRRNLRPILFYVLPEVPKAPKC